MSDGLDRVLEETFGAIDLSLAAVAPELRFREVGTITFIGQGIARVRGLPTTGSEEILRFSGGVLGMALNLDPDELGVVLLDSGTQLRAGGEVQRTGRVLDTPVGEALLGRVVDPHGRPLDWGGAIATSRRLPVEREAPSIMDRAPVRVPLQTGLKVIDALIPIGRGQRELILGDRQVGKTAVAVDAILNQRGKNVLCIYCAIGKRSAAVAKVVAELGEGHAMDYSTVVVATEEDPPGLQYMAPYAATAMAEYFMEKGRDTLVVYDDLTRHARAYRELSLLLRRPPGREAFPGDIFYIHSRLLERSTRLRGRLGGGSLTALPVVETQAQNISAYIPTNLVSITDGQIYLSPTLFHKGLLPAVDVGKSVSRVGGKTQLSAYRAVASDLKLSYSQFEELEAFSRFGTRMDVDTRRRLERGRRVRETLKQQEHHLLSVAEQIAVLTSVSLGVFDDVALSRIADAERDVRRAVLERLPEVCGRIDSNEELRESDLAAIREVAHQAVVARAG